MLEAPKKKYKKNYLTQVICQLTFVSPLESISDELMKRFKDGLGEGYGELSRQELRGIVVHNDGSSVSTESQNRQTWELLSTDKKHSIAVAPESMSITFKTYSTFADNSLVIQKVLDEFTKIQPELETIQRLGLRYVNTVTVQSDDVDWKEYINPKLAASIDFIPSDELRRSMHGMVIQHDDDTAMNFNYGIYNQYFPGPITDNEFILDYDAYNVEPIPVKNSMDLLKSFNKALAIYFENSITDKLRDIMEVIDDEQ